MARDPIASRGRSPEPAAGASPAYVVGGLAALGIVISGAIVLFGRIPDPAYERARPLASAPRAANHGAGGESGPSEQPRADLERPFTNADAAGAAAYSSGDYATALAHFSAAVDARPSDAESHSNLGQVLVRLERAAEALPYFDRAIALNPDRWAYHFNRARALGLLERWPESIESYRTAQRLFPDDYATAFNLAQAYHRAGDEESAVAQYVRAVDLDPHDPSFRLALGISYERMRKGQEAAAAFSEYLRLAPDAPDADKVRARIEHLTSQTLPLR